MDIKKLLEDGLTAFVGELEQSGKEVTGYARQIIESKKESVEELTQALAAGDIDLETYKHELERTYKVAEIQADTLKIESKAALQRAQQKFVDVVTSTAKTMLGI